MAKNVCNIPIQPETREELKKYGHKGETYDEIINKLLEEDSE